MSKIGIFYGSTTGVTEEIAKSIANKLQISESDIKDVSSLNENDVTTYDILLLGTSTWGYGDLQDDWYDAIKIFKNIDLSQKKIALFGCGDSESYSDTFCDGIGIIYQELKDSNAIFIGKTDTSSYTFDSSVALVDGLFVGLPIDDINEQDKTESRINDWVTSLKNQF